MMMRLCKTRTVQTGTAAFYRNWIKEKPTPDFARINHEWQKVFGGRK